MELKNQTYLNWSSVGAFNGDKDPLASLDVAFGLRMAIAVVYALVCAAGLLGNGLVMFFIRTRKIRPTPAINIFVFGLAAADFQFSLTLPFWATEMVLDFSWPFGPTLCKIVPSMTVLSIYTNVFLLTAMSVARYRLVASAVKDGPRITVSVAKRTTLALWVLAIAATIPTIIYTMVVDVLGVKICVFKFPSQSWLGVYQLQRVVFTFVVPLAVIVTFYLLLLRFLNVRRISGENRRQKQVAATVGLVVGCFFVCWFPNHVITFWGILIKFKVVSAGEVFYAVHTYVFPICTCLAHTSSCLNPVLYCLMRREFREAIKDTFRRFSSSVANYQYFSSQRTLEDVVVLPLSRRTFSGPQDSKEREVGSIPGVEMPM
ncbi:relaxin-3 receptor 2 [Anolis carolinensis]|uniref:relaxin-3 receptor 2 n=1 Tax=Anolis carolinensis TaxID=28377 RepID=UPI002F2B23C4